MPSEINFDPEGDLVLVNSSADVRIYYRVNSMVLCLVSPVFKAMLGAKSIFKEAKGLATNRAAGEETVLTVHDDDPYALEIALRILHHQYDQLPPTLSQEKLYRLALVCDKYIFSDVIRHWVIKCWVPALTDLEDNWLLISYVFRIKPLFKNVTKRIILEGSFDESGAFKTGYVPSIGCTTPKSEYTWDKGVPEGVISDILTIREQAIKDIYGAWDVMVEAYSKVDGPNPKCGKKFGEACNAYVYGSLVHAFQKSPLYRDNETQRYRSRSILSVHHLFELISFKDVPLRGHHETCSPLPMFHHILRAILNKIEGLDRELADH